MAAHASVVDVVAVVVDDVVVGAAVVVVGALVDVVDAGAPVGDVVVGLGPVVDVGGAQVDAVVGATGVDAGQQRARARSRVSATPGPVQCAAKAGGGLAKAARASKAAATKLRIWAPPGDGVRPSEAVARDADNTEIPGRAAMGGDG